MCNHIYILRCGLRIEVMFSDYPTASVIPPPTKVL